MLLRIKRPTRPEPLPLRERKAAATGRDDCVFLSVRRRARRPLAAAHVKAARLAPELGSMFGLLAPSRGEPGASKE